VSIVINKAMIKVIISNSLTACNCYGGTVQHT